MALESEGDSEAWPGVFGTVGPVVAVICDGTDVVIVLCVGSFVVLATVTICKDLRQ